MARDKEETKARILAAVGKLLAESGFKQLGVNAIAREAGVDKVLIYRYFENLPSLLQTFSKEGDYWRERNKKVVFVVVFGISKQTQVTALADGAKNCWSVLTTLDPYCKQLECILDWFHIAKKFPPVRNA